jgi:hypothetical protein
VRRREFVAPTYLVKVHGPMLEYMLAIRILGIQIDINGDASRSMKTDVEWIETFVELCHANALQCTTPFEALFEHLHGVFNIV